MFNIKSETKAGFDRHVLLVRSNDALFPERTLRFEGLVYILLAAEVLQRQVIPASTKSVIDNMRKLKSKSSNLDGICAYHLRCD